MLYIFICQGVPVARVRTWKILDRGDVPEQGARTIPWECACGSEAEIPVKGRVIAVTGDYHTGDTGIVFDTDQIGALPRTIQCRHCGRVLTTEPERPADVR